MNILSSFRVALQTSIALIGLAGTAWAQSWPIPTGQRPDRVTVRREPSRQANYDRIADLSGPRFGVTVLGGSITTTLRNDHQIDVSPVITQFGWQFEKQFYGRTGGVTAVSEWVVLLGGLEQSVAIPSLTWMVGIRTRGGAEFGIGPNITPAGAALAIAAGATFRAGPLNVPVNLAVVPSKSGMRVSILSGFSLRRPW